MNMLRFFTWESGNVDVCADELHDGKRVAHKRTIERLLLIAEAFRFFSRSGNEKSCECVITCVAVQSGAISSIRSRTNA